MTNFNFKNTAVLAAFTALVLVGFSGCEQAPVAPHAGHNHAPGEGHGKPTAKPTPDPHAGHNHAPGEGHEGEAAATEEGHTDEVTMTKEAMAANDIRVSVLKMQDVPETFTVAGRVAFNAERMAHVGTAAQGRVISIKVTLGQEVKKGDVIAEIDSVALGEAQSDYLQKRTQYEVSQVAGAAAMVAHDRAARLLATGGIGEGEFQKREAETTVTLGATQMAKAAMSAAENRLHLLGMTQATVQKLIETGEADSHYNVVAPIAGQIIEREITPGEIVGPEREALVVIADMSTLWVLADVPEQELPRLKLQMKAAVSTVNLGAPVDGRVVYIAPELSRETRTVLARVELDGKTTGLLPGMFASVTLTGEAGANRALLVPEDAVQQYEGGPVVFAEIAGEDNTFMAVPVKVGRASNGMVPILEGVEEGHHIVTSGTFVVKAELGKAVMEGKTCSGH